MALIKCPDCGKEVSSEAEVCIHCGRPLKNAAKSIEAENVNNLLKEDAIICARKRAGLFGPIFWLLVVLAVIVGVVIVYTNIDEGALAIMILAFGLPYAGFLVPCVLAIISRCRNNSNTKPAIVFKAESDSFEINHLDKEPLLIKRSSVVSVFNGITAKIWYKDENGRIIKIKVAYCDGHLTLKSIMKKYMDIA